MNLYRQPATIMLAAALWATSMLLLGVSERTHAVPLMEDACERYAAERSILMRLGVDTHLARGPDWAKANLTPPQLDLIQRYIKLDAALKFRCPEKYAALVVQAPQTQRRLDVTPPPPSRKPMAEAAQGVSEKQAPPLPDARDVQEQS